MRRHRCGPPARVEPEWIERLVAPVLTDGFDYVSPYYVRHVNEGAITKGIVYPMFRALYGVRLRQPAAGEFGCSGRLVTHYLEQDFWDVEQAPVGIDLWLAAAAACGEFRIVRGGARRSRAASRGAPADLSTTLAQVVGALFADVETPRRRLAARQGLGRDPGLRHRSGDWSGGAAPERRRADRLVPARLSRAPRDLDVGASAADDRRAAEADRGARPIGFGSTIGSGRASSTTLRSATAFA